MNLGAPPPIEDPDDPIAPVVRLFWQLWGHIPQAIAFVPAALYFWVYWPLKDRSLSALRIGALSLLAMQFVLLVAEVVLELLGSDRLTQWLRAIKGPHGIWLQIASATAAFVIALYAVREFRERKFEQRLAQSLWKLLNARLETSAQEEYLNHALSHVYHSFGACNVERVSLWAHNSDRRGLEITHSWPSTSPPTLSFLETGHGIANLVYADQQIRYVPRLSLPFGGGFLGRRCSWHFAHALSFQHYTKSAPTNGGQNSSNANDEREVDRPRLCIRRVAIEDRWWEKPVRAFVVAPVQARSSDCIGAMSIDFNATNPLGRDHIKTALSLATLIGEELARIKASQ